LLKLYRYSIASATSLV